MNKVKLVAALLLLAAVVVFVVQNIGTAHVSFLAWNVKVPLGLLVVVGFLIGGLAARPLLRFLNDQRKQRAADKHSARVAEKAAKESA